MKDFLLPLEPIPCEAWVNKHSNGRKLQKYRMERIRALPTQTTHRVSCYSPFWLSSDFDHSSYLLLECLQLEKGGTRLFSHDIIWQPAGHLLEIQKTVIAHIWGRERIFGHSVDVMGDFKKKICL